MMEKVIEYHLHIIRGGLKRTLIAFTVLLSLLMFANGSFLMLIALILGLFYCLFEILFSYVRLLKKGLYSKESFLFQSLPVSTKDFFIGKIVAILYYSSLISLVFYVFANIAMLMALYSEKTLPSEVIIESFGFHENTTSLALAVGLSFVVQLSLTFSGSCLVIACYVMLVQLQIKFSKSHKFGKGGFTFLLAFVIADLIANVISHILIADLTCLLASVMSIFETVIVSIAVGLVSFIYICKYYRKTLVSSPYC